MYLDFVDTFGGNKTGRQAIKIDGELPGYPDSEGKLVQKWTLLLLEIPKCLFCSNFEQIEKSIIDMLFSTALIICSPWLSQVIGKTHWFLFSSLMSLYCFNCFQTMRLFENDHLLSHFPALSSNTSSLKVYLSGSKECDSAAALPLYKRQAAAVNPSVCHCNTQWRCRERKNEA